MGAGHGTCLTGRDWSAPGGVPRSGARPQGVSARGGMQAAPRTDAAALDRDCASVGPDRRRVCPESFAKVCEFVCVCRSVSPGWPLSRFRRSRSAPLKQRPPPRPARHIDAPPRPGNCPVATGNRPPPTSRRLQRASHGVHIAQPVSSGVISCGLRMHPAFIYCALRLAFQRRKSRLIRSYGRMFIFSRRRSNAPHHSN